MNAKLHLSCALLLGIVLPAQGSCDAQNSAANAAKAGSPQVEIPISIQVMWHVTSPVSSATANQGEILKMEVDKDVLVDGVVTIPRGTPGEAVVKQVVKAVSAKRNGIVEVAATRIFMPAGNTLKLRQYLPGDDACGDLGPCWAIKTAAVPIMVIAFPLTIHKLAHNARERRAHPAEGKDMLITPAQAQIAYTASAFVVPNSSRP